MTVERLPHAGKGVLITLALVSFGAIGALVFDYVTNKMITNGVAVVVLLGAGGLFWILDRMFGIEGPRTLLGSALPVGSAEADVARRRTSYLVDAAIFAALWTAVAVLAFTVGGLQGGTITMAIVGFAVVLAIAFGLNLLVGERRARQVVGARHSPS